MSDKYVSKTDEKTRLTEEENLEKEKVALADGTVPDGHTPGSDEESKVKFIGNGGATPDECKVEVVEQGATKGNEFTGLTKEELAKYSDDPFWVKVRWALLILFWVAWFGMLAAAIVIIVLAPKCPPKPKLEWWQKEVSYQCYPRSFKDSDGDGIGDVKGIKEKLDYVKDELHAKTLRINSLLKSGKNDFGNEIQDFRAIDSELGTLEEFKHMRISMHKKGMKLVMDFVPNHASVNSSWFKESASSKDPSNKYHDYFIWADGRNGGPPNNWRSVYGGSAWTFHDGRQQYYFHQFFEEQPDLNLYNPNVCKEIEDAMRFWLEQGVDGLHIVGAAYLFESNSTEEDEPELAIPPSGGLDYDRLNHTHTKFQPDTFKILTDWRKIADDVYSSTDKPRALIVDGDGGLETAKLLEYNGLPGANLVSNPSLTKIDKTYNSAKVKDLVKGAVASWPKGKTANWMLGSQDVKRVATRVEPEFLNLVQMLFMTLPGTPNSYYGEEIGMNDTTVPKSLEKDKLGKLRGQQYSRDPFRTPMQWTNGPNAGFTEEGVTPWLPINPNYPTVNVKSSKAAGAGRNHFEVYQELTKLRTEPSFQWGELHFVEASDVIFSFVRQAKGFPGYLVALNFDKRSTNVDFHNANSKVVAGKGTVVANTGNFNHKDFEIEKTIDLSNIILNPGEGVIFKWLPEAVGQQM